MREATKSGCANVTGETNIEEAARLLALSSFTGFGLICRRNIAIRQLLRDMQANLGGSFKEGALR